MCSATRVIQQTAGRRTYSVMILAGTTRVITGGIQVAAAATAAASAARLRGPHPDTLPIVPHVMNVTSEVKGITLVEETALSNKTRIAAVAAEDAIKSRAVVFDRRSMIRASTW